MNKLSKLIVKLRWLIILTVVVITAFFGMQLKNLTIDSDVLNSLPDEDPVAKLYKNIGEKYGGMYLAMIVLETDDVFNTEVLQHVKQITDTLKYTEGISTVSSLTDIIDIKNVDGGIEVGKLVDEYDLPTTKAEMQKLKQYVFSKDLYKGSIVSDDGTATMILMTFEDDVDKQVLADKIQKNIELLNLPEKLYFGGLPMMMNNVSTSMRADLQKLMPIVFFLIAFILLLSFRSVRGVFLPLLTALIAVIWTLGMMVVLGFQLTMISNNIPIILLAVGSAYTIHVINRINQTIDNNRRQAIITALTYIVIPVLLAAITTAIGFVSFVFGAYLTTIRDFGIFSSLGTLFAVILSIFLVPALIAVFSKKTLENTSKQTANKKPTKKKTDILSQYLLKPLIGILFSKPKTILAIWFIVISVSISGLFMIKASVNMEEYFKPDHPSRVSEEVMQNKFGGTQPIFVRFTGDMQNPEVLNLMIKTGEYMEKNPFISKTHSIANLIEEMNDAMGEGKSIPKSQDKIEQLWFLLDGQDIMSQLVGDDLDEGIIQSKFASPKSEDMADFLTYMKTFVQENSNEKCKIEVSGMPSVYVQMLRSLISSQFSSLLIAIILVLIIVGLILKSFTKGLYATIPIIATILILFGYMGYAGISLNIATVLVASIALGIGIDYSIHIITHFSHAMAEKGSTVEKALQETLSVSGKAIVINVISVAAGFLVLLFSEMIPLQNFGLLVALSMIGSGLGALTLLPIVLILVNKKKQKIITK